MPGFQVRLAGLCIEIHSVYERVQKMVKDYCTEAQAPDITVSISDEDIAYELRLSPDDRPATLETLAVCRKISEQMPKHDTLLMHGAVVATGGQAYMFTAPSGTGKTTHIRKWVRGLPDAFVGNGDKPFITTDGERPMACGSPWCGKEGWQTNTMVPLAAIVLMERAEDNEIREVSFKEAFPTLLRQTYRPADTENFMKTLRLLKSLDGRVRFYAFRFNNLKEDAFPVAYHELVEKRQP